MFSFMSVLRTDLVYGSDVFVDGGPLGEALLILFKGLVGFVPGGDVFHEFKLHGIYWSSNCECS